MKKLLVMLFACLVLPSVMMAADKDKLSSKSAVERLYSVEKENKELIKQLKKASFYHSKVWVERWEDGRVYYILQSPGKNIAVVRDGQDRLFYKGRQAKPGDEFYYTYFGSLELTKVNGTYYFLANGKYMYTHEGRYVGTNAVLKTYGDRSFFVSKNINKYGNHSDKTYYEVYTLDGHKAIDDADAFWYCPETPVSLCDVGGFTFPAMPMKEHFIGQFDQNDAAGRKKQFSLGFTDGRECMSNSSMSLLIGNAYYAVNAEKCRLLTDSTSYNVAGNRIDNKLLRVESGELNIPSRYDFSDKHYGCMSLYKADGTKLLDSLLWADFNSNDQVIVYYRNNEARAVRCGALNPLHPQLSVPPLFAEVMYVPDGTGISKPWVRMTSFGDWKPYSADEKYSFDALSDAQRKFEENNFFSYLIDQKIDDAKTDNMTDEEKLMYVYAAGMVGSSGVRQQQEIMQYLYSGIAPSKEPSRDDDDDDDGYSDDDYVFNGKTYSKGKWVRKKVDHACVIAKKMEAFADKQSDRYKLMQSMYGTVHLLKNKLDFNYQTGIPEARKNFDNEVALQKYRQQQEEERQRQQQAQQANELVSTIFGMLGNVVNNLTQSKPGKKAPLVKSSGIRVVKEHTGHQMLDNMKVPENFNYLPIYTGTTGEMATDMQSMPGAYGGSSASSAGESNSGTASAQKKCQSCLSHPGKCYICSGKGQYIPSVSVGHYVKCDHCHGTGICQSCHGSGTRP